MEITEHVSVTAEEANQLEMHSVINILTVITSQLQMMQMSADQPDKLDRVLQQTMKLADFARKQNRDAFNELSVAKFKDDIFRVFDELESGQPVLTDDTSIEEYRSIFNEIFKVADIRIQELNYRWEEPNKWISYSIKEFREDFKNFFHALEKNSKGKYRIIYNIAEQEEKDYLVQFNISSDKNTIQMPLILKDVIRDLIANARKYTLPGGTINIGISQKNNLFRFVVEDNGFGIPKDEIPETIKFGYRASNVKDSVRTMGGGFGLTKAWNVTRRFKGRMWIDSELNRGTKVTIQIPAPVNNN